MPCVSGVFPVCLSPLMPASRRKRTQPASGGAAKGCYGKKGVNVCFFDVSFKLN